MAQASAEKLEQTGLAEKERVASVPQRQQFGKYARAFAKRKKNRAVCPEHQIVRGEKIMVGECRIFSREEGIGARAWRGKGGLYSEGRHVPRRKDGANKKSLPKTSRRKHERVSGRNTSPGRSAESWFHFKSGQT